MVFPSEPSFSKCSWDRDRSLLSFFFFLIFLLFYSGKSTCMLFPYLIWGSYVCRRETVFVIKRSPEDQATGPYRTELAFAPWMLSAPSSSTRHTQRRRCSLTTHEALGLRDRTGWHWVWTAWVIWEGTWPRPRGGNESGRIRIQKT